MKIAAVVLALVASCSSSTAQTADLAPGVRLYQPQNLTPDRAERVAVFVRNLISFPSFGLSWDNVPHAFVMRGLKTEQLDTVEALLKRFDVPEPRVELTIYLSRASNAPSGPAGNPVPADLKSAIDEMKGTLNYARYSLWDAIVLQPKGNGGETKGILPDNPSGKPYMYTVTYGLYGGTPAEGKTLNLSNFTFSIKMPEADIESHIRTDVAVREGQKLVLGKIRLLQFTNADLFLVLSTKVY
jgi:hypothetical protein